MRAPLRALTLLAALALTLVLATSAQAITVTATIDGGAVDVTWTQPDGYPDVFVDIVEVASAPDLDALGFFVLDNFVDVTYPEASESSWHWQPKVALEPGRTYYVHAGYPNSEGGTSWSAAVPFTVPAPPPSATPSNPATPPDPAAPDSPIVPIPGEQAPGAGPAYQARVRRNGATLVLAFRDRAQPDEARPTPYKVCWTRPVGVRCARSVYFDGAWDLVRLRVTPSIGRPQNGKRVVRITWRVGGAVVRQATLNVHPDQPGRTTRTS
jgi:hypothetical protein